MEKHIECSGKPVVGLEFRLTMWFALRFPAVELQASNFPDNCSLLGQNSAVETITVCGILGFDPALNTYLAHVLEVSSLAKYFVLGKPLSVSITELRKVSEGAKLPFRYWKMFKFVAIREGHIMRDLKAAIRGEPTRKELKETRRVAAEEKLRADLALRKLQESQEVEELSQATEAVAPYRVLPSLPDYHKSYGCPY